MIKGRSVTKEQKRFHDMLCQDIGCAACAQDGMFNNWVSVHHIQGRTRSDAHWLVLPLCASHHQDNGTAIAVHPYKARFEEKYGRQEDILVKCIHELLDRGFDVPEDALIASRIKKEEI